MAGNNLDSPPQILRPMQVIPYDEDASPIRAPISPTLRKGSSHRVALGELTPGMLVRRTKGTITQQQTGPGTSPERSDSPEARRRPQLSPDKVGKHFTIMLDNGYEYATIDVRFVLWYYCRTVLQFDSIATAYNSTYTEAEPKMSGEEAAAIVETIKLRWPFMKKDLHPGHFPPPDMWGWHPCDHLMHCSAAEAEGKKSVMRSSKTRVAGISRIREILTTVWDGSWEELLECPRDHDVFQDEHLSEQFAVTPSGLEGECGLVPSATHDSAKPDPPFPEDDEEEDDDTDYDPTEDDPDQPIHQAINLIGGPKVLYHFTQVALRAILVFYLLADWFRPLNIDTTSAAMRIIALDWVSFLSMVYGAFTFLGLVLDFLKAEMLIFRHVDRPPPLSRGQKFQWLILGIVAAVVFSVSKGWHSNTKYFLAWSKGYSLLPSSWLNKPKTS